jgi:predicted transposase YdaD
MTPVASYDLTMRHLAERFPEDMAFLSLGTEVDSIATLSPDLPAAEQRADWLAKVRIGRKQGLVQTEFQTGYRAKKIRRMLSYRVQAAELHGIPVLSVVVLLTPRGYPGPGHNVYRETPFGEPQLAFQWREVRLWEVDPELVLERGAVGLFPLIPLMKGRGTKPLRTAVAAASKVSDNVQRADLLTAVAVLGSLRYSKDVIKALIRSETMKESPIYMEILNAGRKEGQKLGRLEGQKLGRLEGQKLGRLEGQKLGRLEGARTILCRTLGRRFPRVPSELKARIRAIRSLERLEELAEHAVTCRNLAAFSRLLH